MSGDSFGPYRVERLIGSGGSSRVLLALHGQSHERVVLKIPRDGSQRYRAALAREAHVLGSLAGKSRGVVTLLDRDLEASTPWLAMEWIEGISLAEHTSTSNDRTVLCGMLEQLCSAVALIHENGIVHADLSPNNVLLRSDGTLAIIDFGSAFRCETLNIRETVRDALPADGTPGYVAPEVTVGFHGDHRRDLYALGCIAWHVLTGARPRASLSEADRRLLPEYLRDLIIALLQPDPDARPQSAREVARVLAAKTESQPSSHRIVHAAPWRTAQLVGRSAELRALSDAIDATSRHTGCALLIAGEAGIGKTRLLNDAVSRAHRHGLQVLAAACPDAQSARATGSAPAIVAALVAHGLLPSALESQVRESAELGRALRLEAIFNALFEAAQRAPLLLVIDDLHWADDLTLAFAHSERIASLTSGRACIIATYRTKDPALPAPPSTWSRLEIQQLALDDVRSMAQAMLGSEPLPPGYDRWLHEQSAGNPLYLTEHMRERAVLSSSNDEWVPRSLVETLEGRLTNLSLDARRCARVAALEGDEFVINDVARPLRALWPMLDIDAALQELSVAHVIERLRADAFRFTHNLYARACLRLAAELDETSFAGTLALHYEAETALAVAGARELARLGRLWSQAGHPRKAFDYLRRAAIEEEVAQQFQRARTLSVQALAQVAHMDESERLNVARETSALHSLLADLLHREGRAAEADAHYQHALDISSGWLDGVARAQLLRKRARALRATSRYALASQVIAEAERALGACADTAEWWSEWIEIECARFWLTYYERRPFGSLLIELEPVVLSRGSALQRSDFYQCACGSLLAAERYQGSERAARYAALALETIRGATEYRARLPDALMVAAFPLLWGGEPEWRQAIALLEEADRGALWLDDLKLLAQIRTYLALAHRRCGHIDRVEATARAAYLAADRIGSSGYRGAALASSAWIAWRRGDLAEADRISREARRWWQDGKLRHPFQGFLNLVWADTLRTLERFEPACALLAELLAPDLQQLPAPLVEAIEACGSCDRSAARAVDQALADVTRAALQTGFL